MKDPATTEDALKFLKFKGGYLDNLMTESFVLGRIPVVE